VNKTITDPAERQLVRAISGGPLMTYHRRRQLTGFLFVFPTLLFFVIFSVYPMLKAFQVSVFQWDLVTPMKFVGLKNYINLLQSENFIRAFKVTWSYIVLVYPVSWVLGFALAVLLNKRFPGRDFFRTAFFLPTIFPIIGMSLAWWVMYQPTGLVNNLLGRTIHWMTRSKYAMPGIAIMDIWRGMGYWMILFLVGLQSIPNEFYDAAKIDGAGAWQLLRYVTVPLMKPTFSLIVVISLIWGMQVIVPMFVMTQGGPGNATRSLVMLIYQTGIRDWRMGVACAMSVILFFVMLILTVFQLRVFRVHEGE
jgi:multiple sugar transport system permease protein